MNWTVSWPTVDMVGKASAKEKEVILEDFFDTREMILERYKWSAIQLPISLFGSFSGEVIKRGRMRFGSKSMIYSFNGIGTFAMPKGSEMMDFYVRFFEDPAEAHKIAKKKVEDSIELAKRQVDQGVDFICINKDYGYNAGPFISPAMFSEFVTPYLSEIVGRMHDMGTKVIVHSDGDLRLILDQIVSTGIDGYQSIDPQGHMDIAEVKKVYGDKIILMGNVKASILQDTNEALIRESVRYSIDNGKPGGRYIFSSSNCIFAGMPLENYHIMLNEYEKYSWY